MFFIKGILKKEEIRDFTRKDGSQGQSKTFFVEPQGSIYPVRISVADIDYKVGKIGDMVTIDLSIFPYYIFEGKRKKAFIDLYIPVKNK